MDEDTFRTIKAKLDADLAKLDPNASVGIKMGWDVYTEFRKRGLLKPKEVDMILWKWMQPSYQDKLVIDDLYIGDDEFLVGKPKT
jgi:hypothetical protein